MNTLKQSAKPEKVQFLYELHRTPPSVLAKYPDGMTYRALLDGRTFFLLNGQYEVPAPGCMFPAQVFTANVWAFVFRNRRALLNSLFVLAILIVGQFFLWQLPGAPLDEAKLSFIALLSFTLNGVLIIALLCTVSALLIWNFGKGLRITRDNPDTVLELGDGAISIAPDTLIMSESADENPATLADRIEQARAAQKHGEFVVVLTFRHADGIISLFPEDDDAEFVGFPFGREEWSEAYAAGNCSDYTRETWAEYQAYCRKFATEFSEWAAKEKQTRIDPFKALTARLRASAHRAAVMFIVLFLSAGISAQKSVQVENYLGEYRYQNDRPKGEVKFVFQKAVLPRTGDGAKTYRELLPSGYMFSDRDNAGKLIGITVSGATIQPEAPVKKEGSQRMVSHVATGEVRPIPDAYAIPDSVAVGQKLEGVKHQVESWKAGAWAAIKPVWAFVMWFFTSILAPFLIGLGGLCRYISKTAAGESAVNLYGAAIFGRFMHGAHQNTSALLMIIVWAGAVVLLLDSFMWLVWWDFSLWTAIPVWVVELWLAQAVTNWIVPNVRVVGGHGGEQVNRFPRIG